MCFFTPNVYFFLSHLCGGEFMIFIGLLLLIFSKPPVWW
ncbi:hypothetical protein BAZOLSSOX_324 [uncultured Gammaproteobacteria bacterium]|nr:hypothetical protein BAZOLSSOX_324 [uncultured Gammaproteobacteria bacterium]